MIDKQAIILILGVTLIQLPAICSAISCYDCRKNGTDGLSCTGPVRKGATWCFALIAGTNTDGKFTLQTTATGSGNSPFIINTEKSGDGCFYISSPNAGYYNAYCQCKSSDFCLSKLKLSSLNEKFSKVKCFDGSSTCEGDFCEVVIDNHGKVDQQSCMFGKGQSGAGTVPYLKMPFCIGSLTGFGSTVCSCRSHLCNNDAIMSTTKPLKKMVKCHDNLAQRNGSGIGNYCVYDAERRAMPNGTLLHQTQSQLNASSKLQTSNFAGYVWQGNGWNYVRKMVCDKDLCNDGYSSMRSYEHVIIVILLYLLRIFLQ